jgi:molybdopterin molybdotransferase
VISVREAAGRITAGVPVLGTEEVPLIAALGRVLAEDVKSPLDLPAHTNSAMDGYAVRAADVRGASAEQPVTLRIVESIAAGQFPSKGIHAGEATRIFTGAPLPPGSDGVIRQEDTERNGDEVVIRSDRDAGRNFRLAGEDLKKGAKIFRYGQLLGAAQIGVLASMAKATVLVHKRARVAIVASGDEIADLDQVAEIRAGRKTASSNSYTLHALIRDSGAIPVPMGIAADTLESMRDMLERAAAEADIIVSTAGVSVGEHDFVRDALIALSATLDFWRVRMRPGSPLGFAHVGRVPWIGLPGNPVSTMVCYELYVRPAIRRMQGHKALFRQPLPVTLAEPVKTGGKLMHFLRAVVTEKKGERLAKLTGPQGSGILTSMALANALLIVPEDRGEVPAGETLMAIPLAGGTFSSDIPY